MPSRKRRGGNKSVDFEEFRQLPVIHASTAENGKKSKADNVLKASCDFRYLEEKFLLSFSSNKIRFKPKTMNVNFRKQTIFSATYQNQLTDSFLVRVSFRKIAIDFFGFDKERAFAISFAFESAEGSKFEAKYSIILPLIKLSDRRIKPPRNRLPSKAVRQICQQNFEMGLHNSPESIKFVILLEEFKLMPPVDRYKVYGYEKMLNAFLDIENSFELDLLQNNCLMSSFVTRQSAISYRIDTQRQIPTAASTVRLTPSVFVNSSLDPRILKDLQIAGPIVGVYPKHFVIELKRGGKKIDKNELYQVELLPNFFSSAMAQEGLTKIKKEGFEDFMLDFGNSSLSTPNHDVFEKFEIIEWLNKDVGGNVAQSEAIKQILNRSSFPSPYVVFGPPGTGKTSTLVEAVAQIVKLQPMSKVLVTVNSNSACDEIGERLMKFVGLNKMYRFYSPSFAKKIERANQQLKACSNLKYGYHVQPSIQELMSYNVVITTLVTSGRLQVLGAKLFDYIFVDECASSAEAFVSIPLSIAMKMNVPLKASFVFLGDPKQLGQVMRTHHSERYGFSVSLMERVMEMERYKYNKGSGYDPRFIVQLSDNFRSHGSILRFSNKQFYNSILKAKQKTSVANFAIGWEMLPNKNFPILFHASWTASQIDDTSCYNEGEIRNVKKYVNSLLKDGINGKRVAAKDIGIICPYAAQRERLKAIFTNGVEIGTVEYFQGREKLVVIFSTVRSKTPTVGFLKNEKRLNVALTRAKALLIVIGNPETLGKNKFWRKFIKLCCDNKATVGNVPSWVWRKGETIPPTEDESDEFIRLEEMMNEMGLEE